MFSIAESITGGMIMSKITNISGISNIFKGGIVCYSLDSKCELLNTDHDYTHSCNGVSLNTVLQLVENICTKFKTNVGIATTGYAEKHYDDDSQCYVAFKCFNSIEVWYILNKDDKLFIQNLNTGQIRHIFRTKKLDRNEFRNYISEFVLKILSKYYSMLKC